MKVVLVAEDIAPSSAFELLAAELRNRGHAVTDLLGDGKVFPDTFEVVQREVRKASVVVVGMSSSAELAKPEMVACEEATRGGVSFGFYGDTYHCHERARDGAWF